MRRPNGTSVISTRVPTLFQKAIACGVGSHAAKTGLNLFPSMHTLCTSLRARPCRLHSSGTNRLNRYLDAIDDATSHEAAPSLISTMPAFHIPAPKLFCQPSVKAHRAGVEWNRQENSPRCMVNECDWFLHETILPSPFNNPVMDENSVHWQLEPSVLAKCVAHTESSVKFFAERKRMPWMQSYSHNTSTGTLVGVKCEAALVDAVRWVLPPSYTVRSCFWDFEDTKGHSDIEVATPSGVEHRIEVKGLQNLHWAKFQRCVTPGNLRVYESRNAIVAWVTCNKDEMCDDVCFRGWNWAQEIRAFGVPIRTICENVQLPPSAPMHDMTELFHVLRGE